MFNIPQQTMEEIKEQMRRPEGTFSFNYTSEDLFNSEVPGGIIFEITTGGHIFRLERNDELKISFYHSSPGTGTRVSAVDLHELVPCSTIYITFTWTTKNNICLYIGSMIEGGRLISSEGIISPKQLAFDTNGKIYEIGNANLEVMGVTVYEKGQPLLQPTALDTWKSTLTAVEILRSGSSDEGYIFDVVVTNLTMSVLVTGFETYCKKRFIELEKEGIVPQTESLIQRLQGKIKDPSALQSEAHAKNKTVLQMLAEGFINFQSYDECKRAYNKAYGLKFGEIGIPTDKLDRLQKFISYRHRIIHVNALADMLNEGNVPPEEPEFSNKKLGEEAIDSFRTFVDKFHDSTLSLKRLDQ